MIFFAFNNVVQAQVCNITNISNINFGVYDVRNTLPTDGLGRVTIFCSINMNVTIQLDRGLHSSTYANRYMKHTYFADMLAYNIFTNVSRTTIWGDGSGGSSTVTLRVRRNRPRVVTLYGRVPSLQNVSVGTYSDIVTVTVLP